MFTSLTERLGSIADRLKRQSTLRESDILLALREVRLALLEADVALPVVKAFINEIKEQAMGQEVIRSVTPGQQIIKIVHDHLVTLLGSQTTGLKLSASPPMPILMVGLQGSGKTTTSAKIALYLKKQERLKVLLASLDTQRPAAQDQLHCLASQAEIATLTITPGYTPIDIAKDAMDTARRQGYDVVILDTAGRHTLDEALTAEVIAIRDRVSPAETLLVVDAMIGQDAVSIAQHFETRIGLTGIIMTRVDGDARGGGSLSMRQLTGKPIKMIGIGEKLEDLEPFHPQRIAGRILGMGDIVSLVEKATEQADQEQVKKLAAKIQKKGTFDLDDLAAQLRQIRKMGDLSSIFSLIPGMNAVKHKTQTQNIDMRNLRQQEAIILSMTKAERRNIHLLNASRRRRIATGSGTTIQQVNRLLKQYREMTTMMKKIPKLRRHGLNALLTPR